MDKTPSSLYNKQVNSRRAATIKEVKKVITGHLQEKGGRNYMVLNLKDENQRWKPKWLAPGLPLKGNKKRTEAMLHETIKAYEAKMSQESKAPVGVLFLSSC